MQAATRQAFGTLRQGARELWRVRWIRVLAWIAVAALALRAVFGLLLGRAVDLLAAPRGLACRWEDLDLSILSGRGELRRFEIALRAEPKSPPIGVVDYAVFDLELWPLLAGKLRVRRLEIDGMQVRLERAEDGSWELARHLQSASPAPQETPGPSAPAPGAAPGRIDLAPPFAVEALRVQDVSIRLVDRTLAPPFARDFHADLEVSDVGRADRPSRFTATLTGDRVLDGAHVQGEARCSADAISLDLRAQLGGLRPRELSPWLEPVGVSPACDSIQGRLAAHVEATVVGAAKDAVRCKATVSDVALAADGVEALALGKLEVDVESLSRRGAILSRIATSGARANASLERSDTLRIAGLDLAMSPPVEGGRSWVDSLGDLLQLAVGDRVPPWAALLVRDDPRAYPWQLAKLAFEDTEIRLVDRRVDPPATFPVLVDTVELDDIVHVRTESPRPIPVDARVRIPGTAEAIRLEGRIAPFVPRRSVDLDLSVEGITLEALAGYLRAAGLERTVERGGLRFHLTGLASTDRHGATEGWLELQESLAIEGREASQLGSVSACDLRVDPAARLVRFGDIEVSGTQIVLGRDPSRRLVAFGLRTLGFDSARAVDRAPRKPAGPESPAPAPEPEGPPPRIELGRLAWTDSHLAFVDASFDPPRRLTVEPMGFELTGLTVGGSAGEPDPPPARFRVRAVATGIFDEIVLEGRVKTRLGGIDLAADLALSGTGLHGALLAPYLEEIGIEPTLADGKAGLEVHAELRRRDGWRGSLRLANGSLSDGGNPVLSLKELRVDDAVATSSDISIGEIAVVEPFARIERARGSGLSAGGLSFPGGSAATPSPKPPARLDFPDLPRVRLRRAVLDGARILLRDESVEPAVDAEIAIDASAADLSTTGTPGNASARVRIPGNVESIDVASRIVLGETGLHVSATLAAGGVREGPLGRLLPTGMSLECKDGRLRAALEADVGPAEGGGLRAHFAASGVTWRDGERDPWLSLARAQLDVPRVDPAAGVLRVGPVEVAGLEVEAVRDEGGALKALGLRLGEAPPKEAAADAAAAPSPFSRIELAGPVALALDRLVLRDASLGTDARPVEVSAALRVDGPRVLLGGPPEELAPIPWSVQGRIAGLVGSWRVDGHLAPFAPEPSLDAALAADGVRTQGLVELAPPLARFLHGDVDAGTLEGRFDAKLSVHRANPADLGFGRPFSADLRLEGLAFRREPKGEILAGVDSIVADADRIDPARGLVHVRSIEVTRPRGLVRRTPTSFSALGLAFDLPPPASVGEPASAAPPATAPPATIPSEPASSPPASGELRIERVLVSGVAGELRDERTDPPCVLPLAALDVETRGLTTRALQEKIPIRFQVLVTGGPIAGAAGAKREGSAWFDELALSGDLALKPALSGWLRLALTGLDLPEVASLAPPQSLTVGEGALDLRTDVRLAGRGGARVQTTLVFSDLQVEEPKGGPIERSLALPVALDAALFLLRNPAGEHRISVGFSVDESGISGGQIALAATQAIAQVLAVALAGAPLRLIGALVPRDAEKARGPRASAEIAFGPGASDLTGAIEPTILPLRRLLAADASLTLILRHELGAEDAVRAERFANPTESECRDLVVRGRQRKAELQRGRAEVATRVRALLAVGARESEAGTQELRGIDRELASVEENLDRLLEILRSPSPRHAKKRTRVAALEIGRNRLEAIAERVRAGLEPEDQGRIDVRPPRFDPRADGGPGRVVLELRTK
jgi:hypothetical protein